MDYLQNAQKDIIIINAGNGPEMENALLTIKLEIDVQSRVTVVQNQCKKVSFRQKVHFES